MSTSSEPSSNGDGSLNTKKLDTICLFDVDDTITIPRQVFTN